MAPKAAPPSRALTPLNTATTELDTQSESGASQGGSRSRSPPGLVEAPQAAVGGEEPSQEAAPTVQADLLAEEDPLGFLSRADEEEARTRRALERGSSPKPRSTPSAAPRLTQPRYELRREAGPPAHPTGSGSSSSARGYARLRWTDLPLTNHSGEELSVGVGAGLPLAQKLHALVMQSLPQADPRVDCSRFRRCREGDVEADLVVVRIAVSSLCRYSDAFYIGACVREPADRFYNVGADRAGPGQSVRHCLRFQNMCVMLVGTGAQIADRETAAIQMYRGSHPDDRIRNETDAAIGYSRDARRGYLYLCYGPAEREYRVRMGAFMS